MQKWKKSISLAQMSLKDHLDLRKTYVYNLSQQPCMSKKTTTTSESLILSFRFRFGIF